MERMLYDIDDIALITGLSRGDILHEIERGMFPPSVKISYGYGTHLFYHEALAAWDPAFCLHKLAGSGLATHIVYFIRCERFIKIGITNNLEKRMAALQGSNPFPLKLLHWMRYYSSLEEMLFQEFDDFRVRPNNEWFRDSDKIREFIRQSEAALNAKVERKFNRGKFIQGGEFYVPDPPMPKLPAVDQILTDIYGVAALLSVDIRTVRSMSASGKLPKPGRLGSSLRWNIRDLRAWLDAGCPPCGDAVTANI